MTLSVVAEIKTGYLRGKRIGEDYAHTSPSHDSTKTEIPKMSDLADCSVVKKKKLLIRIFLFD